MPVISQQFAQFMGPNPIPGLLATLSPQKGNHQSIQNYYTEASADYGAWSSDFNMHFGYFDWGMNPFNREELLDRMNVEVLKRLQLHPEKPGRILDLGCGLGATSRHTVKNYPRKKVTAITLVPRQIQMAQALNERVGAQHQIDLLCTDYTRTSLPDGIGEAAYAIESACHDHGPKKASFIKEMYRLLQPGGRFAIADGFVIKPEQQFPPIMKISYRALCNNWAVPEMAQLDLFVNQLKEQGFENLKVENLFWKVFASAAHIPFVTLQFLLSKIFRGEKLTAQSWGHLKACILAVPLGLYRQGFGYYLITGNKPQKEQP